LVNTLQKLNIPFGVTEHMKEFLLPNGFTLNQMKAINYCYDKATFISGTSSALTNKMKSLFPKFKNKITTIPNPIDTNIFKPHKEFLQSSNLPFRFIACGLFREEKEFPLLLKAFHQLSQSNDCTLTLVGKGQFEPLLKSIVKELNLESRVTFTGYLSQRDWIKQLCQSHALVLSSSVETFGMVVVEAMACGIPVVATRCGGPEYTIKNNLGILVEPLNFKSLANGMQKMIHEYSQFDPKFIREDVKNRFSTTVHTQSIKKLFRTF
jgi:glycosyltransferase involved in cell wall biosynthesis